MIIWRNGKAGLVGRVKRLIKGVFDTYYSATSSAPSAPSITSYYVIHAKATPIDMVSNVKKITKAQTGVPIIGATSI